METIIAMEREDDDFFDQLKGCRKGKNATKPAAGFTGGVNMWCTCNGFIIKMKENICRETPTEILHDTFDIFTATTSMILFYTMISIFGWDMICVIAKRLQTLYKENILSNAQKHFYSINFVSAWLADLWHIFSHTCQYCVLTSATCLFHPFLKKFSNDLLDENEKRANLNVVEQRWVKFNKMRFMKQENRQSYGLDLLLFRKYQNERRKSELIKQGYQFKPIQTLSHLKKRSYQPTSSINTSFTLQMLVDHRVNVENRQN